MKKMLFASSLCVLVLSCNFQLERHEDSLTENMVLVRFNIIDRSARTVLPDLPILDDIWAFELYGTTNADRDEVYLGYWDWWIGDDEMPYVLLRPGTWNFTLYAYDSNNPILSGKKQGVNVGIGYSDILVFNMSLINDPDYYGWVYINIEFPPEIEINSVETVIDGELLDPPLEIDDGFFVYNDELPSGDYLVNFFLKDVDDNILAVITEIVAIRSGLESYKYIELTGDDFSGPPSMPVNFRITTYASGNLTFTWVDNSINEIGFILSDGTNSYTISTGQTSYILNIPGSPAVSSLTGKNYTLHAYNDYGESAKAIYQLIQVGIPTGLSSLPLSSSSIEVSWQMVTEANDYIIYRSATSTGTYVQVGTSTTTSYADSGLTAATTYYYKVAARNILGTGTQSSYISAQTQVTVTYNINGGTGITPTAQTVNSGTIITLPNGNGFTRDGYIFSGWNTNANGTGTNYNGGSTMLPTASMTLYARWVIMPNGTEGSPYPLTANTWSNGSIINSASGSAIWYSLNVVSGTIYYMWWNDSYDGNYTKTLDVKTSAYYSNGTSIFTDVDSGWTNARAFTATSTGTVKIKVIPYTSGNVGTFGIAYNTNNTRPISSYTITYNINNGTGTTPASQTVAIGNSVAVPNNDGFSRSGYTFGGWNTSTTGTGSNYNAYIEFTPTSSMTLYARWNSVSTGTIITLDQNSPHGWQYANEIAVLFDGNRIFTGDVYTLNYSFTSNTNMDEFYIFFVDCCEATGWNWRRISDYTNIRTNISTGTVISGTVTITATGTATNTTPQANRLVFAAGTETVNQPTITFSTLQLTKSVSESSIGTISVGGALYYGTLNERQTQYVSVTLNAGSTYRIRWDDGDNTSGYVDIIVGLVRASNSTAVVTIADYNSTNYFTYTVPSGAGGTYYIAVQGYDSLSSGTYAVGCALN